MHATDEEIKINFGKKEFKFDIENYIYRSKAKIFLCVIAKKKAKNKQKTETTCTKYGSSIVQAKQTF